MNMAALTSSSGGKLERFSDMSGIAKERSTCQEAWSRFVDDNVCAFSFETQQSSNAFSVDARSRALRNFAVVRLVTAAGPAQMTRRPGEIQRDGKAYYAFYVPTRGYQNVQQFNRSNMISAGSFCIVSTSEPFSQVKPGDNDTICLLLSQDFVDSRALNIEDRCARNIAAGSGLPRLFCDSLIALERESCTMSDQEFFLAASSVSELGILAATCVEKPLIETTFVSASHLAHAKRVIRKRITEPTLTLAAVAGECGVSLRYLHKLFRRDGRSLNEFLMGERLQYARNLLEHAPPTTSVTDVCFASGFCNASRFSTAFRQAFGLSPREVLRNAVSAATASG